MITDRNIAPVLPVRTLLKAALLSVSLAVLPNLASAALIGCPSGFTADGTAKVHDGSVAKLTAASACQYDDSTGNSDGANTTNVNNAGFFTFSDWQSAGKQNVGGAFEDEDVDIDFMFGTGDSGLSGTWSILASAFSTYDDIMIVFKDGAGTHLTGFLLNETFSSGGWTTPFTAPPFNLSGQSTAKAVSHATAFVRGGGVVPPLEINEPVPLLMVLIGFALLVVRRLSAAKPGWLAR